MRVQVTVEADQVPFVPTRGRLRFSDIRPRGRERMIFWQCPSVFPHITLTAGSFGFHASAARHAAERLSALPHAASVIPPESKGLQK